MIKEERFCDNRLTDAVKHLIKTCIYPTPTLANLLTYDRRYKLYTYSELVRKVDEMGAVAFDLFEKREINGTLYWVSKQEIDQL